MTRTMWSGADELAQLDVNGDLIRRFVPDGTGAMDARLATVEGNGDLYWHHTDHQGSVIATSRPDGTTAGVATYSPHGEFGNNQSVPPIGSPFGYTGRQYDEETGLYQYRARYYSPRLGQFLTQDPIGTKDDPNLYLYVGADPVNATDPTGERACILFLCGLGRPREVEVTARDAATGRVQGRARFPVPAEVQTIGRVMAFGAALAQAVRNEVAGNDADTPEERQPGERELGELESIHPPGSNPDFEEELGNMTDDEVMDTIVNPTTGDRVVVRGDSPRVRDGNTRVREAQRRFPSDTRIPVDVLPPDEEFPR